MSIKTLHEGVASDSITIDEYHELRCYDSGIWFWTMIALASVKQTTDVDLMGSPAVRLLILRGSRAAMVGNDLWPRIGSPALKTRTRAFERDSPAPLLHRAAPQRPLTDIVRKLGAECVQLMEEVYNELARRSAIC